MNRNKQASDVGQALVLAQNQSGLLLCLDGEVFLCHEGATLIIGRIHSQPENQQVYQDE